MSKNNIWQWLFGTKDAFLSGPAMPSPATRDPAQEYGSPSTEARLKRLHTSVSDIAIKTHTIASKIDSCLELHRLHSEQLATLNQRIKKIEEYLKGGLYGRKN
jgi:hypothetical protein